MPVPAGNGNGPDSGVSLGAFRGLEEKGMAGVTPARQIHSKNAGPRFIAIRRKKAITNQHKERHVHGPRRGGKAEGAFSRAALPLLSFLKNA